MTRMRELIQNEADNHPELYNQLLKLVNEFDFDSLKKLFKDNEAENKNKQS